METIHPILDAIQHENRSGVLATVIHVEGSAYRKEGTAMLFQDDGRQIGMISGGCLEQDLAAHAEEAWSTNRSYTVTYDMSSEDDLIWGLGAGCNGIIRVLLEPIDARMRERLLQMKYHLKQGKSVLAIRKLTPSLGTERIIFLTGTSVGQERERNGRKPKLHLERALYIQQYEPKPRLIVFGAGPDAKPLVQLASQAGHTVVLCDWREALCSKDQFPWADEIFIGAPKEIVGNLKLGPRDAVVLMTHYFQHDQALIEDLLHRELFYLGILGPRRRTSRLLGGRDIPGHVHAPIGLSIGAEGPEEIAISIMAEIIGQRRLQKIKEAQVVHGPK